MRLLSIEGALLQPQPEASGSAFRFGRSLPAKNSVPSAVIKLIHRSYPARKTSTLTEGDRDGRDQPSAR